MAGTSSALASPAKRRHKNVRPHLTLPALHHFEPVLRSSPRATDGSRRDDSTTSDDAPIASSPPLVNPRSVEKESPRARPVPPPPAGITSRTDLELFRYSQHVKQRLAIRPLFEQRREEEADVAKRILATRESSAIGERPHDLMVVERTTTPSKPATRPPSRVPSPAPSRPRTREREQERERERESTPESHHQRPEQLSTDADSEIVTVRFRTPTPPSSARSGHPKTPCTEALSSDNTHADVTTTLANESSSAKTANRGEERRPSKQEEVSDVSRATAFDESTLHVPFLDAPGPMLSWLGTTSLAQQVVSKKSEATQATAAQPVVCFKVLWRDARSVVLPSGRHEASLRVLLSNLGQAHVAVEVNGESSTIDLSSEVVTQSTQLRPDLHVLTPRWAQWLLTRVRCDDHGTWYVSLADRVEPCYQDVVEVPLDNLPETASFHIEMFLLDGGVSLLVHARLQEQRQPGTDAVDDQPLLARVVLRREELVSLARLHGSLPPEPATEGRCGQDDESALSVTALLADSVFLRYVATQSKTLRLALQSGLYIVDPIDECLLNADLTAGGSDTGDASASATSGSDLDGVSLSSSSLTVSAFEAHGLQSGSPEVRELLVANDDLATIAFLAQAFCEYGAQQALRWLQRRDAVEARIQCYLNPTTECSDEVLALHDGVEKRVAAATTAKLQALAIASIIDDMITDFIALEARMELHHAKFSGGYDDFYASKVQAAYRMSTKRREYLTKKHIRQRAARLIQALQRGILARRRYVEMRVEREKYLFYGFRSSLHDAAARIEDPRARATAFAKETERRRHNFLMQVLHGYVAQNGLSVPVRLPRLVVQRLFNEYGVVVGCTATFGDAVGAVLLSQHRPPRLPAETDGGRDLRGLSPVNERLYSSTEIQAALVVALRSQYDDTFGLSSDIRLLAVSPRKATSVPVRNADETPPRWLLKLSPPFQRANRHRLAALRLTRSAAGRRAAHLVALDYRSLLTAGFASFEACRAAWEANIRTRITQAKQFDGFSMDELVQYALDRLVLAVKDWGLDPEPLFEALNLGLQHRLGRQMLSAVELKFNAFADGVNAMHGGKRNVYALREEIAQELEEFEQLLALRCLNIARDNVVTVAPSEILFIALQGRVDPEYLRHALPTILPIASVKDKFRLARKLMHAYANASYGDAFNSVCWSCLDTAENVTVEAAQFLSRLTRRHSRRHHDVGGLQNDNDDSDSDGEDASAVTTAGTIDDGGDDDWQSVDWQREHAGGDTAHQRATTTTVAGRALHLLTGSNALRFLQFLAKVAHFNKAMQRRVLLHLAPHAAEHELYRLASVLCAMDSFELVTRLFDCSFDAAAMYSATRFWVQYEIDFGLERAEQARGSSSSGRVNDVLVLSDTHDVQTTPHSGI
ncbi:hypothetical protein PINS_up013142 [Pythium insidiosum]|nr:hypothetical protein PINS_up013142 [Pythium insidiosum]